MSLVFGGAGKPLPKTLAKSDKFAWSKFEQPIGWPAGRKPWMVFVAKVSRLSGRDPTSNKTRRDSDTLLNES